MFIRFVSCVQSLAELNVHRARKNTGTHMRAPKRGCHSAAECHFLGPRSIGLLTAESTECS